MNEKKFRNKVLAMALTVSALTATLTFGNVNAGTFNMGDANLDGMVNLNDAVLTLRCAIGIDNLEGINFKLADVNYDGNVNLNDAVLVLRCAIGIEELEGSISDEEEPTPSVKPSKAPEVTEEPKESEIPKVEPTESTQPVQTTTPAPQPTETTDDGVEGVDWKWETRTGYFTYCYCGKLLDVDENGFLITDQQKVDELAEKHKAEGTTDSILGVITSGMTDEEFMSAISNAKNHGGYKVLYRTETYKVKLR